MKILYIENHAVFAEGVKKHFLSPHCVTIVPSLSAARQAMLKGAYDLLLVDYDLDDGKGDQLVRELRTSGSQTPIIGVSSHNEGNTALIKAGANAVCSKTEFDDIQHIIGSITHDKNIK